MQITDGQIKLGNSGLSMARAETYQSLILYSRSRVISICLSGAGRIYWKLEIRYHGRNVSDSWQINRTIITTSHTSSTTT